MNGAGEAEVVPGEQLGEIVRGWVVKWIRLHDLDENGGDLLGRSSRDRKMGPFQWLNDQTGISLRRLSGIANGEFRFVSLAQADLILTAIGDTEPLRNGEIAITANPNWNMERWQKYMEDRGCC